MHIPDRKATNHDRQDLHPSLRGRRIPGSRTLRSSGRWIRSRFVRRAAILGYHRVAEPTWDPFRIAIRPSNFAAHLRLIRERFVPMRLADVVTGLRDGSLPEGAVAVTFDDGYLDTLTEARPLLERYEIPATVFVISGPLGREVWWDALARMLDPSRDLPPTLRLAVGQRESTVAVDQSHSIPARRQLAIAISEMIMRRSPAEIEEALRSLAVALGESSSVAAPSLVDDEKLLELAASELIEIGCHTVNHPFLAGLSLAEQRFEVFSSKADLEAKLGRPVRTFSYPNGSRDERTMRLVREAGFDCACGSRADIVWRGTNRFDLSRLWAQDSDGETFAGWIKHFL